MQPQTSYVSDGRELAAFLAVPERPGRIPVSCSTTAAAG